eukprot:TRINITY_DN47717_c0_g1_i1.p1 TRINITY_DN47717_c0_g1~~TRINITY_DN47717_c0_g1_i1.p1  ORF type:complete len:235 (-),score=29.93 TRINITY_DN47717_c0_g1_i1:87-722(-)
MAASLDLVERKRAVLEVFQKDDTKNTRRISQTRLFQICQDLKIPLERIRETFETAGLMIGNGDVSYDDVVSRAFCPVDVFKFALIIKEMSSEGLLCGIEACGVRDDQMPACVRMLLQFEKTMDAYLEAQSANANFVATPDGTELPSSAVRGVLFVAERVLKPPTAPKLVRAPSGAMIVRQSSGLPELTRQVSVKWETRALHILKTHGIVAE